MRVFSLALKFLLECAGLLAYGFVGYHEAGGGAIGIGLSVALPIVAAALWGTFAAPRSRKRLPDAARFLFETAWVGLTSLGLIQTGFLSAGIALFALFLLNEAVLSSGRSDADTVLKLFPQLNALASIVFGFALALCYGEVAQTTGEFMRHPDLLRITMVVFRPALVLICWYFFSKTLVYKERRTAALFGTMVVALVCISAAEFGLAGLPLFPDVAFYQSNPEAAHLVELTSYALGAYFLSISVANALSFGKTFDDRARQARSATIYAAILAIGLIFTGLGLSVEREWVWIAGFLLVTSAVITSIFLGIIWREEPDRPRRRSAAA